MPSELPPELWILVLQHAIQRPRASYQQVDSNTFPIYHVQYTRTYRPETLKDEHANYRNIRLVCKQWHALAGSPTSATISGFQRQFDTHVNIRSVTVVQNQYSARLLCKLPFAAQITTIILTRQATRSTQGIYTDHLLSHSHCFPSLRALSIESARETKDFWTRLEQSFPNLISLAITDWIGSSASLTLAKLEILHLCWPEGAMTFHFPSLKHLSILYPAFMPPRPDLEEFIDKHIGQLESAIMPTPHWCLFQTHRPEVEEAFWRSARKLKMYGFNVAYLEQFTGPPPDHPLDHLRLFLTSAHQPEDNALVSQIQQKLLALPNIRRLSLDDGILKKLELTFLEGFCAMKGVELQMIPTFPHAGDEIADAASPLPMTPGGTGADVCRAF